MHRMPLVVLLPLFLEVATFAVEALLGRLNSRNSQLFELLEESQLLRQRRLESFLHHRLLENI